VNEGVILRAMNEGKMSRSLFINPLLSWHFAGNYLVRTRVVRSQGEREIRETVVVDSNPEKKNSCGGVNAANDEISRPSYRPINKQAVFHHLRDTYLLYTTIFSTSFPFSAVLTIIK
jgi:hypothetical protein